MQLKLYTYKRFIGDNNLLAVRLSGPSGICNIFKTRITRQILFYTTPGYNINIYLPQEEDIYKTNYSGTLDEDTAIRFKMTSTNRTTFVQSMEVYESCYIPDSIYAVSSTTLKPIKSNVLYSVNEVFQSSDINKMVKISDLKNNTFYSNLAIPYGDTEDSYVSIMNDFSFKIIRFIDSRRVIIDPELPCNSAEPLTITINRGTNDNPTLVSYEVSIQSSIYDNNTYTPITVKDVYYGLKDRFIALNLTYYQMLGLKYEIEDALSKYVENLRKISGSSYEVSIYDV